jgi:DNA-binding transcriptional ArsR family regulator
MESTFAVLAEPTRRSILTLLLKNEQSVGDLERRLRIPQPTVSKHLRVLRQAGLVEASVDAQRRIYRLRAAPLQSLDAWLAPFRREWSRHLDALEQHLDRIDRKTPKARKTSHTRGIAR